MEKHYLNEICEFSQDKAEHGMPTWANLVGRIKPTAYRDNLGGGGVYACFWDDRLIYIGSYVGPKGDPSGGSVADRVHKHVLGFTLRAKNLGFARGPLQSIISHLDHPIADDLKAARKLNNRLERGFIQATFNKARFASRYWNEIKEATPDELLERFSFAYKRYNSLTDIAVSKRVIQALWIKPVEQALIHRFEPTCNTEYRVGVDGAMVQLEEVSAAFKEAFARDLPTLQDSACTSSIATGSVINEWEQTTVFPNDGRWQEYTVDSGELRIKSSALGPGAGRVLLTRPSAGRVHCLASVGRLRNRGIEAQVIERGPMVSSIAVDFDAPSRELSHHLQEILAACLEELCNAVEPDAA